MLTDIFSSFDPAINSMHSTSPMLFWAMNFIILTLISSSYWLNYSRFLQVLFLSKSIMFEQSTRTAGNHLKGFTPIMTTLFCLIIIMNMSGLIPYSFSTTSHLYFTLTFGLTMWFTLILSSLFNSPSTFTAQLLPGGAPDWLNPFLVLIETTSLSVRPITLSFRLGANMTAGHVVMTLISAYGAPTMFTSVTLAVISLSIQAFYILFEMGICIIQAYIFTLLLTLYADEHTHWKSV
uniref:ATP synthase F0 subunit 6 n=1 Tax=Asychis amphiglyptus TaxID=1931186 RepID=UPI0022DCDC23|nr:ATP synthase F0 subunit 6 [Asychis amphiglyptus]UZZ45808.1 ATP synthase F0 subunit 6 [Asychis amphiglyptus]